MTFRIFERNYCTYKLYIYVFNHIGLLCELSRLKNNGLITDILDIEQYDALPVYVGVYAILEYLRCFGVYGRVCKIIIFLLENIFPCDSNTVNFDYYTIRQ